MHTNHTKHFHTPTKTYKTKARKQNIETKTTQPYKNIEILLKNMLNLLKPYLNLLNNLQTFPKNRTKNLGAKPQQNHNTLTKTVLKKQQHTQLKKRQQHIQKQINYVFRLLKICAACFWGV